MKNEHLDIKYIKKLPSGIVDHVFYQKLTAFVITNKDDNEKIRECCSFLNNYPPFVTEYALEYIIAEYNNQKIVFSHEQRTAFRNILLNEKRKTYNSTPLYVNEYNIVCILSTMNIFRVLAHYFINNQDKEKAINEYYFILSGMNENDIIRALFTLKAVYATYTEKYFTLELKTSLLQAIFHLFNKKDCSQGFYEHAIDVLSGYIEIGLWNTFFSQVI